MTLTPLGSRVLIRPDTQPTESASGLIVFPDDKYPEVEQSGEIVALGSGRICPVNHSQVARLRVALGALCQSAFDGMIALAESAGTDGTMRGFVHPLSEALDNAKTVLADTGTVHTLPHEVKPGDTVLFSPASGQEITVDDERLIIMQENDLLAVLEPDIQEETS